MGYALVTATDTNLRSYPLYLPYNTAPGIRALSEPLEPASCADYHYNWTTPPDHTQTKLGASTYLGQAKLIRSIQFRLAFFVSPVVPHANSREETGCA